MRKFRRAVVGLALGAALLMAALPLWFPWVLRPVAGSFQVQFDRYERLGYSQLVVHDVAYEKKRTQFAAERATLLQPTAWLWAMATGAKEPYANITNWRVEISKGTADQKKPVYTAIAQTEKAFQHLERWLPNARLNQGEIKVRGEMFLVPQATISNGVLRAEVMSATHEHHNAALTAAFKNKREGRLRVSLAPSGVSADFETHRTEDAFELAGTVEWRTNTALLSAQFGREDLWPQQASFTAADWQIPAELISLREYRDPLVSLAAQWASNQFTVRGIASALPLANTNLPPLDASLLAHGNTNRIRLDEARLVSPGLALHISPGTEITFTGELLVPEASASVAIDLAQQSLIPVTGLVTGAVHFSQTANKYPRVRFDLTGVRGVAYEVGFDRVSTSGELDWPRIELSQATVHLADGGQAQGKANLDLEKKIIEDSHVQFSGNLRQNKIEAHGLTAELSASGPLTNLSHSGKATVDRLLLTNLAPLKAVVSWRGQDKSLEQFSAHFTAGKSRLSLKGAGGLTENQAVQLRLDQGILEKTNNVLLSLEKAGFISFEKIKGAATARKQRWRVQVEDALFQNGRSRLEGSVNLAWPRSGKFSIHAAHINTAWLNDFLQKPVRNVRLDTLELSGSWRNGPLRFSTVAQGGFVPRPNLPVEFQVQADADETGVTVEEIKLAGDKGPLVKGRGKFPVRLLPARAERRFELDGTEPLEAFFETEPNEAFWNWIASETRLELSGPRIQLTVDGTFEKPAGQLAATAARVRWQPEKSTYKMPVAEQLEAAIHLDRDKLQLASLKLLLEKQPVEATSEMPVQFDSSKRWPEWFHWKRARGQIALKDAQLAPFARLMPELLAPQGTVEVAATMSPGLNFDGTILVRGAATRPFEAASPLRDIEATLRLSGQRIVFEQMRGELGGQPVRFEGVVDFSQKRQGLPLLDVRLLGDNLPLTRKPELILRGDLDLVLSNATNDTPVISGEVRLRDSYFLGDLKQLLPGKVAKPSRRPPYFSFPHEPFNRWALQVRLIGKEFMRVRTPLFRGVVSAGFRLRGTLDEPVALGEATIDSGLVQFPFSNLEVRQGIISLTSDDPYHPGLFVTAESRTFGYDIRMTLSGKAQEPLMEFSSTPSLTSEQILLMLTAGELPRRGFGFSPEKRASKLALFVGKNLLSQWTGEAGAERLTITTGEEISAGGRESYALEYKLNDDWSIIGEYDQFGALNAGIKWRVYSR